MWSGNFENRLFCLISLLFLFRTSGSACGISGNLTTQLVIGKGNGSPLHCSCLENPWTEEPGRLQSIGSQRVGHDWATSLSFFLSKIIWLVCAPFGSCCVTISQFQWLLAKAVGRLNLWHWGYLYGAHIQPQMAGSMLPPGPLRFLLCGFLDFSAAGSLNP